MALSSLTLLLVGEDALAEQLAVHLEHRGADMERASGAGALDTIRVAVPDLVIVSSDAAKSDAERIRDGLTGQAQKTRLLVLCDRALASRLGTHRHSNIGALEASLGADVIASCIESLCALIEKQGDASKQPLRTLIANVQKSHVPATAAANKAPYSAKKTLQMPMAIAVPAEAPKPIAIEAPKPIAAALEIEAPKIEAPKPIAVAPKIEAPKPITVAPKVETPTLAPKQDTRVPLAGLLAPLPAPVPEVEAELDDEPVEISVALSMAPTMPPEPMPAPEIMFEARPEESLTPTHVEVAIKRQDEPAPAPSRARAVLTQLRRPQQLGLAAGAVVCISMAGFLFTRSDEPHAKLAPSGSASLHAVSRAEPVTSAVKSAPVVEAIPVATPAVAVARPAKAVAPQAIQEPTPAADEALEAPLEEDEPDHSGAIDPARRRADHLVNVGHRLRKQGRWGMAEASYLKALKEMPTYGRAISGLVQVHLGRRDGTEAVRWAKKLVALQPKPRSHHRLLGDAYALAGDKTHARKAWQTASRLGDRTARERLKK